jgi:hypothetical protein
MTSAYPILLRLRRQGYSRHYLRCWCDAVRWLRQNNRWLLDQHVIVHTTEHIPDHVRR